MNHYIQEDIMLKHCMETLPQALAEYDPFKVERYKGFEMTFPAGPWDVKAIDLPSEEEIAKLEEYTSDIDELGRPLNPWFKSFILSGIGLVAGTGDYRHWGRNYTVDPIIIAEPDDPKILLILRENNLKWALPGGFVDPGEKKEIAARRETEEETNLILPPDLLGIEIYDGMVADERITAHAWGHTTALMWVLEKTVEVTPGSDALAAEWFSISHLPFGNMHGSHQKLIEFALEEIKP